MCTGLLGSSCDAICLRNAVNISMFGSSSLSGCSHFRGSVYTMICALETASLGVHTRIADSRYRFSSDKMAISRSFASERIPCQLRMFRNSFNPEQNCRWKNDVLAS